MLIGYARVSTDEQDTSSQKEELRAAGCTRIFQDVASGANRERPNLAKALAAVREGDTLIVVRIDRLARSLLHLLQIVEDLQGRGAFFKSLRDPIDTSSAQGLLVTQILGAVAEFERTLIRERTKTGVRAAVERGAQPGNPKMKARDRAAIAELRIGHKERYLQELIDGRRRWLPVVTQLRPHHTWPVVLQQIRALTPPVRSFTTRSLVKACRGLVQAGYADPVILEPTPRVAPNDDNMWTVAARLKEHPNTTLEELATYLGRDLNRRTSTGLDRWSPEAVRRLIKRAQERGLLPSKPSEDVAGSQSAKNSDSEDSA
jgi:DNA invertase Pin-like site-specific DNA recombinase